MNKTKKIIITWTLIIITILAIMFFIKYLDYYVHTLGSTNKIQITNSKSKSWNTTTRSVTNKTTKDNEAQNEVNKESKSSAIWKSKIKNTSLKYNNIGDIKNNKSIWFKISNNYEAWSLWEENQDRDWDLLTNIQESSGSLLLIKIYKENNCDEIENSKSITSFTDPNNRDSDNDGISDWKEFNLNLNPNLKDTDWDWLIDWIELKNRKNPNCKDNTEDKYTDSDWDGLFDSTEIAYSIWDLSLNLNIENIDSDSDWIFDWIEDFDNDGLSNLKEQNIWTSLINHDSDQDWQSDFEELKLWSDPINPYSKTLIDNSWLFEIFKNKYSLKTKENLELSWAIIHISMQDLDWDLLTNIDEQKMWTDPNNNDTDWDWKLDWQDPDPLTCNYNYICDKVDSDWDWINDKNEINWWIWFWSKTIWSTIRIEISYLTDMNLEYDPILWTMTQTETDF